MADTERFDYGSRVSRLRSLAVGRGLDGMLFSDLANIRYLAGFTGSDGALLLGKEKSVLLVDGRYTLQAGREAVGAEVVEYKDKVKGIAQAVGDQGWNRVGFESLTVTVHDHGKLKGERPDVEWVPLAEEMQAIRAVKEEREIQRIRKAASLSAQALSATLGKIRRGVEEREIALELECQIRSRGAEEVAFDVIVASGDNAAMPHAKPGARRFQEGDFIILDYGAVYEGYRSDETCTVALGSVSERQREVYRAVREAQRQAMASVRAGAACSAIDRAARDYLEGKGLARYFTHGTGHGVGLYVHEEPRVSYLSASVLEAGMVVTIEPGVYLPGQWGVRIEDTVLVKKDGFEVLTCVSKDLQVLDEG